MQRPVILFDIDKTLCVFFINEKKETEPDAKILAKLQELNCRLFSHKDSDRTFFYFVFADWLLCFKTLIDWKWKIGFFSSGDGRRNEAFRDWIAKEINVPCDSIDCYHREHMTKELKTGRPNFKSIEQVGLDLNHTLLVDDSDSEWPQVILGASASLFQFAIASATEKHDTREITSLAPYECLRFPVKVLGVLIACKQIMEEKSLTLRAAASSLLPPKRSKTVFENCVQVKEEYVTVASDLIKKYSS